MRRLHLRNGRCNGTSANGGSGSRLCENAKVLGFRVSLYPSQVATRSIRRDLKGRLFRAPHSVRVFTQPRSISDVRDAIKKSVYRGHPLFMPRMCQSKGSESVANLLRRDLTIYLQAFHLCETLLLTGRSDASISRTQKQFRRWSAI